MHHASFSRWHSLHYTLFKEQIDAVAFGEGLTDFVTIPEWAAYTLGSSEQAWAIAYSLMLMAILVLSFAAARRFLGVKVREVLIRNTDELAYPQSRQVQRELESAVTHTT